MSWSSINPEDFKKNSETYIYKSIILSQFALIMQKMSSCGLDPRSLMSLEQAIKTLESALSHRLSEGYQLAATELSQKANAAANAKNYSNVYELLRLRFDILEQEMSALGYTPEDRAIDVIGEDEAESNE